MTLKLNGLQRQRLDVRSGSGLRHVWVLPQHPAIQRASRPCGNPKYRASRAGWRRSALYTQPGTCQRARRTLHAEPLKKRRNAGERKEGTKHNSTALHTATHAFPSGPRTGKPTQTQEPSYHSPAGDGPQAALATRNSSLAIVTPPFFRVPDELLLGLFERLALVRASRHLYKKLNPHLYFFNVCHEDSSARIWAAWEGSLGTMKLAYEAGADPNARLSHYPLRFLPGAS